MSEHGGVLVMVALWLPVVLVLMTFVVDVGNWFVHKRHLQMQADAGALAAVHEFYPCSDSAIADKVAEYSGDTYNSQIGGTPASRIHRLINSKTFYDQPSRADDTVEAPPCSAGMLDVKLTETDLPWFFRPVAGLLGGLAPNVPYINAQARVSVLQEDTARGALPVAVPDNTPRAAAAYFVDESTGAVLASSQLSKVGTSNGLTVWDDATAPAAVKIDSANTDVGVVIALSGGSSTTCGQPLVNCYDAGATTTASGMPTKGILHIRGWTAAGTGAPGTPILRGVDLVDGSCSDPYFSSAASTCTIGVQAKADFGAAGPPAGTGLVALVAGQSYDMTYDATAGVFSSPTTIPLAAAAGPVNVAMDWKQTSGTLNGKTCTTKNNNPCTGHFENGNPVQRAFSASDARSGPIKVAQVYENNVVWSDSLQRCSSVQSSCTHNLVVRIGVQGNLQNATGVNDPVVALRIVGGSQNQSLDCDPALSQLKDELAQGCAPTYARNTGTACPGSASTLWASPQPWSCVAIQTGSATNQVPAGMNMRILGTDKPTSCTAPNHWSSFPNLDPGDPRLMQVFLTPFGSFAGNGSTTVPVIDFAEFYVTGWTGQGQGFSNPCQGNGDDPVPNNDAGYIVGHFVKYIQTLNTGSGSVPCDFSAFGSCIAVLTR